MPTNNSGPQGKLRVATKNFRMGARLDAIRASTSNQNERVLTDEDRRNLDRYVDLADQATEILQLEVSEIGLGNFSKVTELFDRKNNILRSLERQAPLVEPFIKSSYAQKINMKESIGMLRESVEKNSILLGRMASATGKIIREVQRVTDRHSLSGLYGQGGRKIGGHSIKKIQIDDKL
jgi:hypothetical protein